MRCSRKKTGAFLCLRWAGNGHGHPGRQLLWQSRSLQRAQRPAVGASERPGSGSALPDVCALGPKDRPVRRVRLFAPSGGLGLFSLVRGGIRPHGRHSPDRLPGTLCLQRADRGAALAAAGLLAAERRRPGPRGPGALVAAGCRRSGLSGGAVGPDELAAPACGQPRSAAGRTGGRRQPFTRNILPCLCCAPGRKGGAAPGCPFGATWPRQATPLCCSWCWGGWRGPATPASSCCGPGRWAIFHAWMPCSCWCG